ncbi:unnamed protein product [Cylindrotheca closterium]|uniref:SPX domain-containing protein n=1 Tax=Cylindrotheca closterium TaxID=2856 RepID=A0AAD2G7X6_9STRA|nr:unnamed protein product [Cylindrotheca closterium]
MKSFDVYFQRVQISTWKEHYINYASMKESLKNIRKRRRGLLSGELQWASVLSTMEPSTKSANSTGKEANPVVEGGFGYALQDSDEMGFGGCDAGFGSGVLEALESRLSTLEHHEFEQLLQTELKKCSAWFGSSFADLQSASFEHQEEEEIDILELYGFAVVNICAFRQLIRKYNAQSRMFEGSRFISKDYFDDNLIGSLEPLQDRLMSIPSYWKESNKNSNYKACADELESILDQTSWKQQTRKSPNRRERVLQTVRYCFTMGRTHMGVTMEPRFLYSQVRGLKKEMKSLVVWREKMLNTSTEDNDDSITGGMDPENVWPLILNLVSCFLFMMNNYIIEPSSAYYANALGSSDALSGIMMGMAPWFALMSAVGYSVWTNKSYYHPIVFSGILQVIGNTLYGAALGYRSMTMCLIGRGIAGLGAPRIINRRYIADSTPFAYRTLINTAFAMTTAIGAASGPGAAILLDMVPEFQFTLPILGVQSFNGMTGPGFVMALLWSLYLIVIVVSFKEPNRSGLAELKQREAKAAGADHDEPLTPKGFTTVPSADDFDDDISIGSLSVASHVEESKVSKHTPLYCIKNMNCATILCMSLIFMKRIALESIVGSTSVITKNRYAWSIRNVGALHLANGIIVIPVSVFAGWLSQFYEDRYLALWFMGITALGLLITTDLSDFVDTETYETYNYDSNFSVGPVQYVGGSLIAFSGVEACESFIASLMSKCVPSALAVGTFNSGVLATLVGTGGRAVGDLFITFMGIISIRNLLNLLIVPGLGLVLLSMFLLWRNYSIVAV